MTSVVSQIRYNEKTTCTNVAGTLKVHFHWCLVVKQNLEVLMPSLFLFVSYTVALMKQACV